MKKAKILIWNCLAKTIETVKGTLSEAGFNVTVSGEVKGKKLLSEAERLKPDLIIYDICGTGKTALRSARELELNRNTAMMPVIFTGAPGELEYIINSEEAGVYDYMMKPYDLDELLIRIESTLSRNGFYRKGGMVDQLTGLYNRNYLIKNIGILYNLSRKYKRPFSIVVIELDGVEKAESVHGEEAGEFVLKDVASAIESSIREMDTAGRIADHEFCILLPETAGNQVSMFLKRIKQKIQKEEFMHGDEPLNIGVSAGSATCMAGEVLPDEIIELAKLNISVKEKKIKAKFNKKVIIIEDEEDIAGGLKLNLQSEGFDVGEILYTYDSAIDYIRNSKDSREPVIIILDLDLCGQLSTDFLGLIYARWKNARVYIFTAYLEYLDKYPYLRDIVAGVYSKSQFSELLESMKSEN